MTDPKPAKQPRVLRMQNPLAPGLTIFVTPQRWDIDGLHGKGWRVVKEGKS